MYTRVEVLLFVEMTREGKRRKVRLPWPPGERVHTAIWHNKRLVWGPPPGSSGLKTDGFEYHPSIVVCKGDLLRVVVDDSVFWGTVCHFYGNLLELSPARWSGSFDVLVAGISDAFKFNVFVPAQELVRTNICTKGLQDKRAGISAVWGEYECAMRFASKMVLLGVDTPISKPVLRRAVEYVAANALLAARGAVRDIQGDQ